MKFLKILSLFILSFVSLNTLSKEEVITLFPMERYSQHLNTWIKPQAQHYEQVLLTDSFQKEKTKEFYEHFLGHLSPWHPNYVDQHIGSTPKVISKVEQNQKKHIEQFGNYNKNPNEIGYGSNFHPLAASWIANIKKNMQLSQFAHLLYDPNHRGIAVDNLHARLLPTEDVHFYHHHIAGQGYPFDNLQMSSIWMGTPVYIVGKSQDKEWLLVLTPDFIAWVKAKGIARVTDAFVHTWQIQAKKHLAAITKTKTVLNDEKGVFLALAYVGSVFPAENLGTKLQLMVPWADANGNAVVKRAFVHSESATMMPLSATPKHFSSIISTLIGRSYGWGNLYFYNDCSAELKNLFTPFGLWLPRDSSDQARVGKMIDLSSLAKEKRLAYVVEKARPFMTLIYVKGHIALYIGQYSPLDKKQGHYTAMTYQNVWGLFSKSHERKAVVGRAAFFPLLLQYPEDQNLEGMLDKKIFQVIYLDL